MQPGSSKGVCFDGTDDGQRQHSFTSTPSEQKSIDSSCRHKQETPSQRQRRLRNQRERTRERRKNETAEQRAARLAADVQRRKWRIGKESHEQRRARLEADRVRTQLRRSVRRVVKEEPSSDPLMLPVNGALRGYSEATGSDSTSVSSSSLRLETPEQRANRLEVQRIHTRQRRQNETEEQRAARIAADIERRRLRMEMETDEERSRRLEVNRIRTQMRRRQESNEKKAQRLENARVRARLRRKGAPQLGSWSIDPEQYVAADDLVAHKNLLNRTDCDFKCSQRCPDKLEFSPNNVDDTGSSSRDIKLDLENENEING